jgi:hypothetical protein
MKDIAIDAASAENKSHLNIHFLLYNRKKVLISMGLNSFKILYNRY